ncbi:MAG: hypothetical protein VX834_01450, partial [Myxococcota bacterium]|nr:hypothetical protein [Myxococcota bacterium]
MSDSLDDAQPSGGGVGEAGGGSADIHSISINCAGCGEVYSVSDDDGLAGMSFPCDDCGTMVEVPELPWEGGSATSAPEPPSFELPELPPEGAESTPIEGGTSITVSCFSCLEEYNVSADDGLSGMAFPCDNCGADVEVPEHPWPEPPPEQDYDDDFFNVGTKLTEEEQAERSAAADEEAAGFELPPEAESASAIEGGTSITVSCFSCLEEYNVSADDGLAGMAFPCDNCGADVEVPDHPWPEPPPEQDYDDDFFNVGTKLTDEELAEREEIRQAETEAAAEAAAENEEERKRAEQARSEAAEAKAAADAKEAQEQSASAASEAGSESDPTAASAAAGEAQASDVEAAGPSDVAAEAAPAARAKGKRPKKPKWAKKKKAKKAQKAKGAEEGTGEGVEQSVPEGEEGAEAETAEAAPEQSARSRIIEIVERATGRRGGAEPAKRSLGVSGGGGGGGAPPSGGGGGGERTVVIEQHGSPGGAPERKRASRPLPDRPREPIRGGISAPSGNYGLGGGGGGGGPPDEIRMRIQRGGGGGGGGDYADGAPETGGRSPTGGGASAGSAGEGKAAGAGGKGPQEPLVIRIFGGVKKMFGGKSPQDLLSNNLGKPGGRAGQAGGAAVGGVNEGQPAKREVRIIQEAAGDVRKGVGVGAGEGVGGELGEELDAETIEALEEEGHLKVQKTYVKIGLAAALVVGVLVGFREQIFGPLLGDAAPEGSGQFWEDRQRDKDPSAQPTVDLTEMMGAESETETFKSKSLSGETVDALGYQNLKDEVAKLSKSGDVGSKDLLLWAQYRLATTFGDADAKKALLAQAPKRLNSEKNSPMGLAAALGAMTLQGKAKQARRAASKLTESEGSRSPQMLLVRARNMRGRNAASKAVPLLDEAIEKQPSMIDAHILRAQQILDGSVDREWVEGLKACLGEAPDPDSVVRAAEVFVRGGKFGPLGETMQGFSSLEMAQHIADTRKDRFLKLVTSRKLADGELSAAAAMAEERMDSIGDQGTRLVRAARYREALGQDALGLLDARLSGNISPA